MKLPRQHYIHILDAEWKKRYLILDHCVIVLFNFSLRKGGIIRNNYYSWQYMNNFLLLPSKNPTLTQNAQSKIIVFTIHAQAKCTKERTFLSPQIKETWFFCPYSSRFYTVNLIIWEKEDIPILTNMNITLYILQVSFPFSKFIHPSGIVAENWMNLCVMLTAKWAHHIPLNS
jgi:hypothetical protein